jgi:hypothetical protein
MDKKSLFWRYGHTPVETALKHRFNGVEHVKIRREGQDHVHTRDRPEGWLNLPHLT